MIECKRIQSALKILGYDAPNDGDRMNDALAKIANALESIVESNDKGKIAQIAAIFNGWANESWDAPSARKSIQEIGKVLGKPF